MTCIFCGIVDGTVPSTVSYSDDKVAVFDDINPQAPIHKLIIPKKHIATLNDLTQDDADYVSHMILTVTRLAKEYGIDESGYRVLFNCNKEGGQTVYHIHTHLLGGRVMQWPPG